MGGSGRAQRDPERARSFTEPPTNPELSTAVDSSAVTRGRHDASARTQAVGKRTYSQQPARQNRGLAPRPSSSAQARQSPLSASRTGLHRRSDASRSHRQRRRRRRTTRPEELAIRLPNLQRTQGTTRSNKGTQRLEAAARTPSGIAMVTSSASAGAGSSATIAARSMHPGRRKTSTMPTVSGHHRLSPAVSDARLDDTRASTPLPGAPPHPGRSVASDPPGSGDSSKHGRFGSRKRL